MTVVIYEPCGCIKRFDGCSFPHKTLLLLAKENSIDIVHRDCPHIKECKSVFKKEVKDE